MSGSFSFRFSVDGTIWSDWFVDTTRNDDAGINRVSHFHLPDDLPLINKCYQQRDSELTVLN